MRVEQAGGQAVQVLWGGEEGSDGRQNGQVENSHTRQPDDKDVLADVAQGLDVGHSGADHPLPQLQR